MEKKIITYGIESTISREKINDDYEELDNIANQRF